MRCLLPSLLVLLCTGCIHVVPDKDRVTYNVLDADTKNPVQGVKISLLYLTFGPALVWGFSGTTDERGTVRLARNRMVIPDPKFLYLPRGPGSEPTSIGKIELPDARGDYTLWVTPAPTIRIVVPADYVGPVQVATAPPIELPPRERRDLILVFTPGTPVSFPSSVGPAHPRPRYVDSRGRDLARIPETDRRPDRAVRFVAFDAATAVTTVHVGTRRQFDRFVASLRA